MRSSNLSQLRLALLIFCVILIPSSARPQTPAPQSRIVDRVDERVLVTLRGNTHPLAQPQFDRGTAPPDLPMSRMLLVLKRSDAQESALEKLLDDQQDRNSPSYHQWLTPDQFGQQFGPSDQDLQTVAAWLQSRGFRVAAFTKGRTAIEFSGTAAQVLQSFHTAIHKYSTNGVDHWANVSDPQIPAALTPVVAGVSSLHNFPMRPAHRVGGVFSKSRATGQVKALQPGYTTTCDSGNTCYFLGPYDFATIYNVLPLWNASPAIDGTGQTIAILGESNINLQDVRDFRNLFGLPSNDPQIIIDGTDPGLVQDAETEADLDVEWSGAVAKGATVKLVVAASTDSTSGVELAAVYAVENNIAPIISESFLQCEFHLGAAGNALENAVREQAAAQGITYLNASGDQGAAGCDFYPGSTPAPAETGLMVNGLASSPYGVAVGGTDFLNFGPTYDFQTPSPYWSPANDPHQASARGYVPETTWNSTCTNNIFVAFQYGTTPEASCNNSQASNWVETAAGGGGKSNCTTSSGSTPSDCLGGYAKPSWQSGFGVPQDGARDLPDVSLFASGGFMNSAYIVCESDQLGSLGSCGTSSQYSFITVGGTSASTPAFAGIMAMVNQFTQSPGQGNANYELYKLASSSAQTNSACNASSNPGSGCIFNDVTSGTIEVPCAAQSPNCNVTTSSDAYGVLSGYSAGNGYDLATGLGSVNAFNLVHGWNPPTIATTTTLAMNNNVAVNITHGQSVPVTVNVAPSAATGDVVLIGSPSAGTSVSMGSFTLQNGAATGSTTGLAGSGGTSYQVTAHYDGDATHAPSDSSSVSVIVAPEPSNTLITIPVFDPITGNEAGNTPASLTYGSPYIARMDVGNAKETVSFPMKPTCAPLACPTGNVTLTDSVGGATLGVFPLNLMGFADYRSILLSGGVHQLTASYPGDNSYQSSAGNYTLTVTPAATQIPAPYTPSVVPFIVGNFGYIRATVSATTSFLGATPTGTITFYDGATALAGTITYSGIGGSPNYPSNLTATITPSFTTTGTHQITATYAGDANYVGATSSALSLPVVFATSMVATANPANIIYGQNASVTIAATVSTGQPASNAALKPTGAISFSVSGTVTTTTGQDASGNWILQATLNTVPQQSEPISANYSGDSNYASSYQWTSVTVTIPDFAVSVSSTPLVITAGQTGSTIITITPTTNYTSTVALSCYGTTIAGAPCSFSPATVTLSNGASATSTLSLAVPAASSTLTAMVSPPNRFTAFSTPSDPGFWWAASGMSIFVSFVLLASPRRHRCLGGIVGLVFIGIAAFAVGCGSSGGGTGGGGEGGGGGPVATTTSLAASSGKIAPGASATLTATIKASKAVTGYVNFNDASFPGVIAPYVNVVNGTAQAQMTNTGSLSADPGTHAITAVYSGDATSQPSQSGNINIVVTGTMAVLVVAQTSVDSHTTELNVTIQ